MEIASTFYLKHFFLKQLFPQQFFSSELHKGRQCGLHFKQPQKTLYAFLL